MAITLSGKATVPAVPAENAPSSTQRSAIAATLSDPAMTQIPAVNKLFALGTVAHGAPLPATYGDLNAGGKQTVTIAEFESVTFRFNGNGLLQISGPSFDTTVFDAGTDLCIGWLNVTSGVVDGTVIVAAARLGQVS